jgi:hypothetical protein
MILIILLSHRMKNFPDTFDVVSFLLFLTYAGIYTLELRDILDKVVINNAERNTDAAENRAIIKSPVSLPHLYFRL